MKTLTIVFLLFAVGLLALDDLGSRNAAKQSQGDLADERDNATKQSDKQTAQISALNTQIDQLKMQLGSLHAQQTAPPVVQTGAQLATTYSAALVIITGRNAVGSGFVCSMDGRTYIITNAHVLCDNPDLKFANIRGVALNVGLGMVAVGHDVVRLEITGAEKAFDIMPDASQGANIGDGVAVLGNAEGAGVAKQIEGKILAFGPNLIEVDAQFVPGNSGSPIVDQRTGKVLGVATYTIKNSVEGGSVQTSVRHFGYRLDDIKQWEALNWQTFYAQSMQVEAMKTLSGDFIKMFGESGRGANFDPDNYESPALQRSIRSFLEEVQQGGKTMSFADRKNVIEHFVADLRSVSHADIIAFNNNTAYDYFRREVEDQAQFRDEIYQGLSRSLDAMH